MDITKLTGETIYQYGTYIFIFWVATFLIRKMWVLFEGRIKDTQASTLENQKILKDISVIQAQTLSKINKGDEVRDTAWHNLIDTLKVMCGLLNGQNPSLIKLQDEMKEQQNAMKIQQDK